jgi:hypothetical protein
MEPCHSADVVAIYQDNVRSCNFAGSERFAYESYPHLSLKEYWRGQTELDEFVLSPWDSGAELAEAQKRTPESKLATKRRRSRSHLAEPFFPRLPSGTASSRAPAEGAPASPLSPKIHSKRSLRYGNNRRRDLLHFKSRVGIVDAPRKIAGTNARSCSRKPVERNMPGPKIMVWSHP